MSQELKFYTSEVCGFIDLPTPLEGWILSTNHIKDLYLISDKFCERCVCYKERPDVIELLMNGDTKYIRNAKSGFVFKKLNPLNLPDYFYILVEHEDGTTHKSMSIAKEEIHSFYLDGFARISDDLQHTHWENFLPSRFDLPGKNILEIGGRRVTGDNGIKHMFKNANCYAIDIKDGIDITVVGDAHYLSSLFDIKFDLIFSSAVFEHLALPWIVAIEIVKSLKVGGHVFIETHYSFTESFN